MISSSFAKSDASDTKTSCRGIFLLKSPLGYTFIELMMVVAIIGVLASVSATSYSRYIEKVQITKVIVELRNIEKAITAYYAVRGSYPASLADIGFGNVVDRWGNPYEYMRVQDSDDVTGGNGDNGGGNGNSGSGSSGSGSGGAGNNGKSAKGASLPVEGVNIACLSLACLSVAEGDVTCLNVAGVNIVCLDVVSPNTAHADQSSDKGNGGSGKGKLRRDRNMNPINSDYDLYSMGKDGETSTQLNSTKGKDDIIRALNGEFVGLASDF
jgi:general secretion pathway protein G